MIRHLFKMTLAGVLLYGLIASEAMDFHTLSGSFFGVFHLLLALAVLGSYGAQIQRWRFLLRAQRLTMPLWPAVRLFFIGQFFFLVSLGALAGEGARGYYLTRRVPEAKLAGVSTVLADRLLGLFSYLILGFSSFLFIAWHGTLNPAVVAVGLFSGTMAAAMLLGAAFLFWRRGRGWFLGWLPQARADIAHATIHAYRSEPGCLLRALLVSFASNLIFMAAFHFAALALAAPMTWTQTVLVVPMVVLANSLPISIGGLGVGETASEVLLAQMGVTGGAAMMLLMRLTYWGLTLPVGAVLYILEKNHHRPEEQPATGDDRS